MAFNSQDSTNLALYIIKNDIAVKRGTVLDKDIFNELVKIAIDYVKSIDNPKKFSHCKSKRCLNLWLGERSFTNCNEKEVKITFCVRVTSNGIAYHVHEINGEVPKVEVKPIEPPKIPLGTVSWSDVARSKTILARPPPAEPADCRVINRVIRIVDPEDKVSSMIEELNKKKEELAKLEETLDSFKKQAMTCLEKDFPNASESTRASLISYFN